MNSLVKFHLLIDLHHLNQNKLNYVFVLMVMLNNQIIDDHYRIHDILFDEYLDLIVVEVYFYYSNDLSVAIVFDFLVNEHHHANPNRGHQLIDVMNVNIVLIMIQDQLQYVQDLYKIDWFVLKHVLNLFLLIIHLLVLQKKI
jgi:hypothetical protein